MNWTDHDHRGDYAYTQHGHGFYDLHDVAEEHHRHYDIESEVAGLREDLGRALERIRVTSVGSARSRPGELDITCARV